MKNIFYLLIVVFLFSGCSLKKSPTQRNVFQDIKFKQIEFEDNTLEQIFSNIEKELKKKGHNIDIILKIRDKYKQHSPCTGLVFDSISLLDAINNIITISQSSGVPITYKIEGNSIIIEELKSDCRGEELGKKKSLGTSQSSPVPSVPP